MDCNIFNKTKCFCFFQTEIQYAELDTFRPPSQQKNNGGAKESKPVEPEEPVSVSLLKSNHTQIIILSLSAYMLGIHIGVVEIV